MMHVVHYLLLQSARDHILRNIPPEIEGVIVETSRREGISLNKATLRLLEKSSRKPKINTDFEEFSGSWDLEQADAFDAALAEMRRIELVDWEPLS